MRSLTRMIAILRRRLTQTCSHCAWTSINSPIVTRCPVCGNPVTLSDI